MPLAYAIALPGADAPSAAFASLLDAAVFRANVMPHAALTRHPNGPTLSDPGSPDYHDITPPEMAEILGLEHLTLDQIADRARARRAEEERLSAAKKRLDALREEREAAARDKERRDALLSVASRGVLAELVADDTLTVVDRAGRAVTFSRCRRATWWYQTERGAIRYRTLGDVPGSEAYVFDPEYFHEEDWGALPDVYDEDGCMMAPDRFSEAHFRLTKEGAEDLYLVLSSCNLFEHAHGFTFAELDGSRTYEEGAI